LLVTPASAQIINTELAGNSLSEYPYFEYVRAINENATMEVALDPTRFPDIIDDTCDIYVVASKTISQWISDPSLSDVTPGGEQSETFSAGTIQNNRFQVTGPSQLSADAGAGLGVGYDVVLDCDQNGSLSDGDYIDGRAGEAGFYAVHDTTAAGPFGVTELDYHLTEEAMDEFSIPDGRPAENLFYPTNIASMGRRPLVVVGHGNGHQYDWYDHIGTHLASYGYIVMSLDNATTNSEGGVESAADTILGHTDAFIDQVQAGAIASGALVDHIDTSRIVWIGHSRGAEAVAIAYDRLFDETHTPIHFSRDSIKLISSMLPTDFRGATITNPHDASYHLWTASGDSDVNGSADCNLCQTFHIHDRATHFRQSTVVQGTGHAWFHNGPTDGGHWDPTHSFIIDPGYFEGPCSIGPGDPPTNDLTHLILLGHLLPLVKHYVDGNIPALDFLTRQYESFRPIGVPTGNPCVVVSHEYRNGSATGNLMIDDYQTNTATNLSSSNESVTPDVDDLNEGRLDDGDFSFEWDPDDPDLFNGATQAGTSDSSRGAVFEWTSTDKSYEWAIASENQDFSSYRYLSFRAAQGTRHPNTLDADGDLTFSVTLRDGSASTSTINIGAYGGGLEQPYARDGGWHNEMETIRIRLTDFLNNGSGLDLTDIAAVRLELGPSSGSPSGRIVLDELMLTSDVAAEPFEIVEPTTARPAYAGTSVAGSRVLVRLLARGGLDMSLANLTITVDGVDLTAAQIPTAAEQVGGETWVVIAPGPKSDGCYDLDASLTTPAGVSASQELSLCYADDEARDFDRVLAIDQTNSMHYDGTTDVFSTAKMDAARAAARFFVDLSNPTDQLGAVSFQRRDEDNNGSITEPDELAERVFPLDLIVDGVIDRRSSMRTDISNISPDSSPGFTGPETSQGAALVEARTMLNSDGMTGHEQHIVLLTDGLENYAPYWAHSGPHGSPLRPSFYHGVIRVDTIGIGGDADDALLVDIADATDGRYRNLNEGAGSFFLLSRLSSWYKAIDEDVRGEQRFYYQEGLPTEILYTTGDAGDPDLSADHRRKLRVGRFYVEPALDWMTVAFHANIDNAVTVKLYEPGATSPIAISPPGVSYRADAKHSVYRVRTPMSGTWFYTVEPHFYSAEFFAIASAPTSLSARVGPRQLARRPGGDYSMPLRVWVADAEAVLSATVAGYVRRPDGVKDSVTLHDNGVSMDGALDDGIYGYEYIASIAGAYWVDLKVSGVASSGEPFERYLSTAFYVPGDKKRPVQVGEGLPPVFDFDGRCHCEAEARYTLAGYSGVTIPRGAFDTIANPSYSLGIKPAVNLAWPGAGRWSAGVYVGYDHFANAGLGSAFELTHISPELEWTPSTKLCPEPAIHVGVGAYRNESNDTELGWNVGASLGICLNDRIKLLTRYDYRSVDAFSRDYTTVQVGLRVGF
jgi:hypothetical protein